MMWTLTIRTVNKKVIEYHPKPGVITFGRTSDNNIPLRDDTISRQHAELDFDPNKKTLVLRDLDSTNGTYVNGKRILTPTQLEHGDQVRMGTSLITVKLASTQRLERKNIISLTPELSEALLIESIENFGFLLNDLTQNLVAISDQTKAMTIISTFTKDMVDATACHIFLGDELNDLAQKGIPTSIAQTVIDDRTPILLSNIQADKKLTKSLTSSSITSLILVPVVIDTLLSGIIYAYQEGDVEKPFNRNDLQVVMAISNQVTLTLQRFEHEKELVYHANHDPLTKLPNRTRLLDRLKHALARSKREKYFNFALFFFDVDNFKLVNDSLGHIVGDKLLVSIGNRLVQSFREVDTIARLGGDEFVILYEGLSFAEDTVTVAERLMDCFTQPFIIEEKEIFVTISVGGTTNRMNYSSPEDVLRDADIAMYHAKEKFGSNFELYDSEMHRELMDLMELQSDVRKAVYQEELVLHYQPVISVKTGQIVGFEALVRWNSPERGFLPPDKFLFHLDTTSLLNDIDLWVLGKAMDDFSGLEIDSQTLEQIYISVNVSEQTFFHEEVSRLIDRIVDKANFNPNNLVFEITEKANIKAEESVIELMNNLRSKGIRLSLDDFGTGYSTLGYLHRFPVDFLKIDKSFIQSNANGSQDSRIVETIVSLANHIGMSVIAEGVETKEQLDFLREINCEYVQGYYFSHPTDIKDVHYLITKNPVWK